MLVTTDIKNIFHLSSWLWYYLNLCSFTIRFMYLFPWVVFVVGQAMLCVQLRCPLKSLVFQYSSAVLCIQWTFCSVVTSFARKVFLGLPVVVYNTSRQLCEQWVQQSLAVFVCTSKWYHLQLWGDLLSEYIVSKLEWAGSEGRLECWRWMLTPQAVLWSCILVPH